MDEQKYIEQIIELKKENDELCEMLEQSIAKIKELNLNLSLSRSGHGKTGKDKKIENYEARIEELEAMANLVTMASIESYENEIASLTKKLINLRLRVENLEHKKHHKKCDIETLADDVDFINIELLDKFISVVYLHSEIIKAKQLDASQDLVDELMNVLDTVPIVFNRLKKQIKSITDENDRLCKVIGDKEDNLTIQELKETISSKDKAIEHLQNKISLLEFELNGGD